MPVNLIYILYYLAFVIHYFTNIKVIISLLLFGIVAVCATLYFFSAPVSKKLFCYYIAIVAIDLFACIAVIYNRNHTLADPIKLYVYQMIAILLCYRKESLSFFRQITIIVFWVLFFLCIHAFVNSTCDLDFIISMRIGSNSASVLAIAFLAIDYIWREFRQEKISYFYCLVTLLISFLSRSIAGFCTTILLFIIIIFYSSDKREVKWFRKIFYLIIIAAIFSNILELQNFLSQGDSSTRIIMWKEYFLLLRQSFGNLLLGANISKNELLNYYKNLHNGFLNWHYFYGLLVMLFFLFIVAVDIFISLKRKNIGLFALLIATIARTLIEESTYAFMVIWCYVFCESVIMKPWQLSRIKGKKCGIFSFKFHIKLWEKFSIRSIFL